jgi:hypothetical protein
MCTSSVSAIVRSSSLDHALTVLSPVDASSSIVMGNVVASPTSGSGPPRMPVSIASMAATVR